MNKDYQQNIDIAKIQKDIEYIKEKIKTLCDKQKKDYVTRIEFKPVKDFYHNLSGNISNFTVGALIALGGAVIFAYQWIKNNLQ